MMIVVRQTKSDGFTKQLKSAGALKYLWRFRNQNGAFISHIQISKHLESPLTYGQLHLDSQHYLYTVKFESGFELADYLQRNKMASMEEILHGTDAPLRRPLLDYMVKRERSRLKRRERYLRAHPEKVWKRLDSSLPQYIIPVVGEYMDFGTLFERV